MKLQLGMKEMNLTLLTAADDDDDDVDDDDDDECDDVEE